MVRQHMPHEGKQAVSPIVEHHLLAELHFWGADVRDFLLDRFRQRNEAGLKTYGTPLQTHNGRDALLDALDEGLDMVQYLMQAYLEAEDEEYDGAKIRALYQEAINQVISIARFMVRNRQDVVNPGDTRTK